MSALTTRSRPGQGRATLVEELMAIMLRQESLCHTLLELSARERVAVLSNNVDDLERTTREKRSVLQALEWQESARQGAAERLAEDLGLQSDAALVEIAQRLGLEDAQGLLEVRARLMILTGKLRESNEDNISLLQRTLTSLRGSLRRLRQSLEPVEAYSSNGRPVLAGIGSGRAALDLHA